MTGYRKKRTFVFPKNNIEFRVHVTRSLCINIFIKKRIINNTDSNIYDTRFYNNYPMIKIRIS